eukprot:7020969-Pyramimonas_sp.AAC.1
MSDQSDTGSAGIFSRRTNPPARTEQYRTLWPGKSLVSCVPTSVENLVPVCLTKPAPPPPPYAVTFAWFASDVMCARMLACSSESVLSGAWCSTITLTRGSSK